MDKITHKVRCEQWTSIIKECLASERCKRCQALLIKDSFKKMLEKGVYKADLFADL